jgi:imidazolonepropionase-like amidohydrolase
MSLRACWVVFAAALGVAQAGGPPYAITNAKIVVSAERTIPNGVVLLRDGKIEAVGESLAIPSDARVYDAKGQTVYPGLIDAYTHYGFPAPPPTRGPATTVTATATPAAVPDDINAPERYLWPKPSGVNADGIAAARMTFPTQPDPRRSLGFTAVLAAAREGYWRGTSALVNLAGGSAAEAVLRSPAAMHISFSTSARASGYPGSLMGVMAVLRQTLLTAQQYREKLEEPRPPYDPASAALLPVLDRKIPVIFAADGAEPIRRAIRFADEFRLQPVIYGGAEAWKVAELLRSRDIPVIVDLALLPPSRATFFGGSQSGAREEPANSPARIDAESNPGRLEKAGVRFAFASAGVERPEQILAQVRTALGRGLSRAAALRALTASAAQILGAGRLLGSIEPGRLANLTLLDGEIFEPNTQVKAVVIDGRFYLPPVSASPRFFARGDRSDSSQRPPLPARRPPDPDPPAKDVVIQNATILTVTNGAIEGGSIWIQDGKIKQLGKALAPPAGARIIDGAGRYVMPGIIDSHSHMMISGGVNESSLSVTAQVRITDVLDPDDIDIYRALAGGVTTLNILHGSANAIGGQNATVKLKWGRPVDEMLFPGAPRGIKFALGENPKRSNFTVPGRTPRFPATRMGVENVIREAFTAAREYARQKNPPRNLTLETLADVLAGKILVHAHCYRADEISMLLDLADEFGFKIRSLQHVLEGYKVAAKIRKHGAGASTFADNWAYKMEAYDGTAYNTALLVKAGVRTAVNSDSDERVRRLYQEAAKAMKYGGLTETQALRLITIDPAWMLGIDQRVGSLEAGKDADLAIFNGHPFSPYARVEMTLIDGQVFFDRQRDLDKRLPWKEEFEPETPRRPTSTEATQ